MLSFSAQLKNATDLMKVVVFASSMQVCHQVASSLLTSSSCIKSVGFIKLHQVCWLHQVASSLLASSSCIKSVDFIKLHLTARLAASCYNKLLVSS